VPVAEPALCRVPGARAAPDAAGVAPGAVPDIVPPGTSGAVPLGTPPHPARAKMAAPARTAADPRLLM
jgi:hypothetical protein